jgi:hypothetical protein
MHWPLCICWRGFVLGESQNGISAMAKIINERMTAQIEGDFVFFLIGLKVNVWWKIHKWLPLLKTMPAMLKELDALPAQETGFLGYTSGGAVLSVQYWRSFAHLEAYAKSQEHAHFPVWRAFNKRMKHSRGDVGIWHETYLVRAGEYENVYSGMPPHGLGRVADLVTAEGARSDARGRLKDNA